MELITTFPYNRIYSIKADWTVKTKTTSKIATTAIVVVLSPVGEKNVKRTSGESSKMVDR